MQAFVELLGTPRVRFEQTWFVLPAEKSTAVIAFLVCRAGVVNRSELIGLFWSDYDQTRARSNLRQLLRRMRQNTWCDLVRMDQQSLTLEAAHDLQDFWTALEQQDLSKAVRLGANEFLSGFELPSSPDFEDWLALERQLIRDAWRDACLRLAPQLEPVAALRLMQDVLRRDPFAEDAVLMALRLAVDSTRLETIELFEHFRIRLREELNLEPSATTLAFLTAPFLPMVYGTLVGRESELQALQGLFTQGCRLVSLVAAGGMGKTRLALAFAQLQSKVILVELANATTANEAIAACLAALNLKSSSDERLVLKKAWQQFDGLLVLDNLESHLQTFAPLLAETLTQAARLRVLVTSRQVLDLQAEQIFVLGGLALPDMQRLFIQSACRADARFMPLKSDEATIAAIARRLDGMPLAIELAASWVRSLSLRQLEQELSKGLDILSSQKHDTPERHRSIKIVLTQSFEQLTPSARTILEQLSFFNGGLSLQAARAICQISLADLERLISSHLVQRIGERFYLHDLIKQFALARLESTPNYDAVAKKHATFFATDFYTENMTTSKRRTAPTMAAFELELPNLRLAWQTALSVLEWLSRLLQMLDDFYDVRGLYHEALERFQLALTSTQNTAILCQLRQRIGVYAMRLGDLALAETTLLACLELQTEPAARASTLHQLGQLAARRAQWQVSEQFFEQGCEASVQGNFEIGLAQCLNGLGINAKFQEQLSQAKGFLNRSLEICERIGYSEGIDIALTNLANVLEAEGDLPAAKVVYQRCLEHFTTLGHKRAIAVIENNLGVIATKLGTFAAAQQHLEQSIALKTELGDQRGISLALISYAELEIAKTQFETARSKLLEAIAIALEVEAISVALIGFSQLGIVFAELGLKKQAALLLHSVIQHPACNAELRSDTQNKLIQHQLKPVATDPPMQLGNILAIVVNA